MATTSEATLLTDQHRRRQVAIAVTADSQMRRTWDATLDPANLEATQPIWKRAMLDTLTKWWKVSADTAAQYLPRFRQAEIGDGGIEVGIPRFDRALAGRQLEWGGMVNVLWHVAMGQTREAAYTAARELFLGMFHEAVLTGGRMTIQEWARRDSRAIGWRRVSDGNPCAFCAMLVSRGPVYTSEEHALTRQSDGQKFHPHCGCTVEVVYGDWKPSGREQQWVDDYYRAAESLPDKTPRTADTVLPIMRRSGHYRDSPKPPSPRPASQPGRTSVVIEKLSKDTDTVVAVKAHEHRAMCRSTLEKSGFISRDSYDRAVKQGESRDYDEWVKSMVDSEASWRDPQWLAGGEAHEVGYASEVARADKWDDENNSPKENHAHELDTAERLRANGVQCIFQIDHEYVNGMDGKPVDKGLADLADGTELKTLYGCSTKNTVFSHMKNTAKKRDAVRVVFDNSQNTGMSDDELAGYLRRAQAFKKGAVYVINSDGLLVRIK